MNDGLIHAVEAVASCGPRLSGVRGFSWPAVIQQAVYRLRLEGDGDRLPTIVGMIGGASSGKSTVYNNLLGGRVVSRITARGHTTLGPILAAHEHDRPWVERMLDEDRLLPGFRRTWIELDGNAAGEPDALCVLFHPIDSLRGVLLFDLPDFTSEAARADGDLTLSLLPWFDRILVVIDHERWFDRQSLSTLRAESTRFGQRRWVLFNRMCEGPLDEADRASLSQSASVGLGADGMTVLAFRFGRGFRVFPPGTLEDVKAFIHKPGVERKRALLTQVAWAANRVLNENEERAARRRQLRESLHAVLSRTLPTPRDCMTSLMTPPERQQVDFVFRVLRIEQTREWVTAQTRRLQKVLKRVPVVGMLLGAPAPEPERPSEGAADRTVIAAAYYEAVARRRWHEVRRCVQASAFWDELRRSAGLAPPLRPFTMDEAEPARVRGAAKVFDAALADWLRKVEGECQGASPRLIGAIGASAVGLALVLITVSGPVAALTLASAKGAIATALGELAAAAGAGALLGKPMARLVAVVQERLLSSPELDRLRQATAAFLTLLEWAGRRAEEEAVAEAARFVMDNDEPVVKALEVLREPMERPS